MTCEKHCLHWEVCRLTPSEYATAKYYTFCNCAEKCECFKDKSKYIELPCKVGDEKLIQQIKDRIAYHSNNHRHYYELGKAVINSLAYDLVADFHSYGYRKLIFKPGDSVWYISNKRPVEYIVHFVGINEAFTFFNCHKKNNRYVHDRSFDESQIGKTVFLTKSEAEQKLKELQND